MPCYSTNSQCGNWVAVSGEAVESGALLQTNGYQWLPALCCDSVPPNTLIVGVSESDGSQYLGRVGGNTPRLTITELGKNNHFCFSWLGEEKQVANGELMVLTND